MIILQCSTWRACGTGHREKHFEMITAPDRWMTSPRSPFLSVNLCAQCQCIYVQCVLRTNVYARLCPCAFIRMCECVCDMAGRHAYKPYGVPYSEPPQSSEDLHQTDYNTATMTASNGKNKTPFNEVANLRNITLCSEI